MADEQDTALKHCTLLCNAAMYCIHNICNNRYGWRQRLPCSIHCRTCCRKQQSIAQEGDEPLYGQPHLAFPDNNVPHTWFACKPSRTYGRGSCRTSYRIVYDVRSQTFECLHLSCTFQRPAAQGPDIHLLGRTTRSSANHLCNIPRSGPNPRIQHHIQHCILHHTPFTHPAGNEHLLVCQKDAPRPPSRA